MLIHYHYDSRGKYATMHGENSMTEQDFAKVASLPSHLARLIKQSAQAIKQRGERYSRSSSGGITNSYKEEHIQDIRARKKFGDDYYFVSQLFDEAWRPAPILT